MMERREAIAEQVRKESEARKDFLNNGTRSAGKKGFWQGIGDWFSGK
ncbi:hypothetical protein H6F61_19900 [Cyanobacteria bacterium FACHB-472]|nr:hypothetical protein [Cyanobacteria bacterium FACHB-472]